jgi:hypothetical protein
VFKDVSWKKIGLFTFRFFKILKIVEILACFVYFVGYKTSGALLTQEEFQTESISACTNVADGKQGCQL